MSAPVTSEFERTCWDIDRCVSSIMHLAEGAEYVLSQMNVDGEGVQAVLDHNTLVGTQDGIVALAEKARQKIEWLEEHSKMVQPTRSKGRGAK